MKDSFKKIWDLRKKKSRLEVIVKDKYDKLIKIIEKLKVTERKSIKDQAIDYFVPINILFEKDTKLAEEVIKENKVIHRLKIDSKKYNWQKNKIEGYLVNHVEGILLLTEPPEGKEYKKITFIQI